MNKKCMIGLLAVLLMAPQQLMGVDEAKGPITCINKILKDERGAFGAFLAGFGTLTSFIVLRYAIRSSNNVDKEALTRNLAFYYGAPLCALVALYGGYMMRHCLDKDANNGEQAQ